MACGTTYGERKEEKRRGVYTVQFRHFAGLMEWWWEMLVAIVVGMVVMGGEGRGLREGCGGRAVLAARECLIKARGRRAGDGGRSFGGSW